MTLTIPTIHSNGTNGERLLDTYAAAHHALSIAEQALCETAPNGRDYYVMPGTFDQADKEHMGRLKLLGTIQRELEELMMGVQDQIDERAAQRR